MTKSYQSLSYTTLGKSATIYKPAYVKNNPICESDPAIRVMTDLRVVKSYTIGAGTSIEAANDKMIACGVRLLFVTDAEGLIHGVITANDILGEKPVKYISEHGGARDSILVQDIMTARKNMEALDLAEVEQSSVGDIAQTMRTFQRHHVLVIEKPEGKQEWVCGIFSSTQIGNQLGVDIVPTARAKSFAELELALVS